MPRANTAKIEPDETNPYSRQAFIDNQTSNKKKRVPGRPWTKEEVLILFNIAIRQEASAKAFEGVVEGRTGKQCYDTFK